MKTFLSVYSLRTGAITTCILFYILALSIIFSSLWMIFILGEDYEVIIEGDASQTMELKCIDGEMTPGAEKARVCGIIMLIMGMMVLVDAMILHVGIQKNKSSFVRCWLLFTGFLFGYAILYDLMTLTTTQTLPAINLAMDTILIYLWIIVLHYFWVLKEGGDGRHRSGDDLIQERIPENPALEYWGHLHNFARISPSILLAHDLANNEEGIGRKINRRLN